MQSTIQYIKRELKGVCSPKETEGITRLLLEHYCGWDYTEQIMNKHKTVSPRQLDQIKMALERLKMNEPVQYIIGETEFMGLPLKVNPSVLIPRPETEELVHWIIKDNDFTAPRILDIGTGSGCIALALKKYILPAKVSGTDISDEALETAGRNAGRLNLNVDFFKRDVLHWEKENWGEVDMIVSNPPYVRESEIKEISKNVLDYEPEHALFVSDEDPLLFYNRITSLAEAVLSENGLLYFEINESLGREMINLLKESKFENIQLRKDLNGKERMICGRKKKTDIPGK